MYNHYMRQFLTYQDATAEQTLEWSVDEAEDRLLKWQYHMMDRGLAGKTIQNSFSAVKRWFRDHRIRVDVTCRNIDTSKTYLDHIPTREQVQLLLDSAKLHHKIGIALVAFSGLRPVDAASLTYANISNSFENGDEVLTIVLKQRKTRAWYFTFIGPQGTRYIRQSLWQREKWEHINEDTPLIAWEHRGVSAVGLRKAIERVIERTVGKHPTGEPFRLFRPYGLRKYFRRGMASLGQEVAEFMMGHRSGLVATYAGLRDMDTQAIEALKKEYISILPELETEVTDTTLRARLERQEEQAQAKTEEIQDIKKELADMRKKLQEFVDNYPDEYK